MCSTSELGNVPRLYLEDSLNEVLKFESEDQALKDEVHERLQSLCEEDARTGCWIYTGSWDRDGTGRIRVGMRVYTIQRVAAWLYVPGFRLCDKRVVYHTCESLACFNYEHLEIADTHAEAMAALRKLRRFGSQPGRNEQSRPGRRFNRPLVLKIRQRVADGEDPREICRTLAPELGVRPRAIADVIAGRTWQDNDVTRRKKCA